MRRELPTGIVTFLFTDVEGSTRLLHELGPDEYAEALMEHRRVLREAFRVHAGVEVDTQGDAFCVAFATPSDAIAAADEGRRGLESGQIRVRMGIHTGTPLLTDEGYVGADLHRAARIGAAGHGGQILVSAATAALARTESLRDLGLHRLKDLAAAERIYQLGDGTFPALKTLHQTNLPVPATPFLGRERELAEVVMLISREDVRLLTLTGPGGTGKTRLGAQAAAALADRYPDGVWWVPLAAVRDPALVLETAAQALGAKDGLADYIGDKSMLLLFDNFEQVLDAARGLSELLVSCPSLELIATSREPLRVTAEQEYQVPPFVPEEGVGFFLARARAIHRDFESEDAIVEICRRLDNLPLALELAAARVKALTTQQILERLEQRLPLLTGGARDLPERQRTLRATIEWSYDLLNSEERRLFARLAVFRGGCTLEAAEQVASADIDTLQSLVDKSLVRHMGGRYWMLETIREYANEQLDDPTVARRHADYYLTIAKEADEHLRGDPKEWLDRLDPEHDNLRAALDRLTAWGETQLALALGGSLQRFWYLRGHHAEARRRLEAALTADARPTIARAYALVGAALFALERGDNDAAHRYACEAVTISEAAGDAWTAAISRLMLAHVVREEGDFAKAQEMYEQCTRGFQDVADDHFALIASFHVAWMAEDLGDKERALALHQENLLRSRATNNKRIEAVTLYNLARFARFEGRFREALALTDEGYRINRELDDPVEISDSISRFASMLVHAGEAKTAVRLLSCSEALREDLDVRRSWVMERNEETLEIARSKLDEAAIAEAWEEGRTLTPDQAAALAREALE